MFLKIGLIVNTLEEELLPKDVLLIQNSVKLELPADPDNMVILTVCLLNERKNKLIFQIF